MDPKNMAVQMREWATVLDAFGMTDVYPEVVP